MVKEPKPESQPVQAPAPAPPQQPMPPQQPPQPQMMPPIMAKPRVTPPDQTDYINALLDTLSAQANLIAQYQTILGLAPLVTPTAAPASNGGSGA